MKSFRFHTEIDRSLYTRKVLKLLLQPLVENALLHGLGDCKKGNSIIIRASISSSLLLLSVTDNGSGMTQEQLENLNRSLHTETSFSELGVRSHRGIGLKNIQSRIELYYGEGYGLSIESREGEGTSVLIRLPIRYP